MTWSDDDQVMADLRNWLVDQGFVVLSDQLSDSFGNQVVEMARPIGIRLVRDRDQWAIDLLGPMAIGHQWTFGSSRTLARAGRAYPPPSRASSCERTSPTSSAARQLGINQAQAGDIGGQSAMTTSLRCRRCG
jgi:hypothetical protein